MIEVAPNGVPYPSIPDGEDIYSMWKQTQAYQNEIAQQRAVPPGINPADVVTERMYVAHNAPINAQRAANLWGETLFPDNYVPSTIRHLVGGPPPPPNTPINPIAQPKPKTGTINDILGEGNWEEAIDVYPDDYEDENEYRQYEHNPDYDEVDTDPHSIDNGDWYWLYVNNAGYPLETPWWEMPEYKNANAPIPAPVTTTPPPTNYNFVQQSNPVPMYNVSQQSTPSNNGQPMLLQASNPQPTQSQQPTIPLPLTYIPQTACNNGYYGPGQYQQPMYNQGGFQTTQYGGSYMNFGGFQLPPPPPNHIPGTIPFFNNPYQQQATYQQPYPQFYNYNGPILANKIEIICRSRPDLARKYGYYQYLQPGQNQGAAMNPYMQQQIMNSPAMMYQQQQAYMKERLEMEKLKWKMRYKFVGREDEYNEEEIERMILGPQAAVAAKPMTEEQLREEELWARTMRNRESFLHPVGETDAVRQANIIREHSRRLHEEMDDHDIFTFFNQDLPKLMREFWIEDNILIPNAGDVYKNEIFGSAISKFQHDNPSTVTASYEALKAEQEKRMQEGGGLTAMGGYSNFFELREAHRKVMEGRVPDAISDSETVEKRNVFTSNLVNLIDTKEERKYRRLKEGAKPK